MDLENTNLCLILHGKKLENVSEDVNTRPRIIEDKEDQS
jgi:hypothetical protein